MYPVQGHPKSWKINILAWNTHCLGDANSRRNTENLAHHTKSIFINEFFLRQWDGWVGLGNEISACMVCIGACMQKDAIQCLRHTLGAHSREPDRWNLVKEYNFNQGSYQLITLGNKLSPFHRDVTSHRLRGLEPPLCHLPAKWAGLVST